MSADNRRVALVTGATGGIGAEICAALARDGFVIAAADLAQDRLGDLLGKLEGNGHAGFSVDVTSEASVEKLFDDVTNSVGRVTALVACAGILLLRNDGSRPPITEISLENWEKTQKVNVTGTFLCCREYARRANGVTDGRIITVSSVAAQLGGYRSSAAYIASKSAVLGFTKALARELAERRITVNAVAPGLIDAPMLRLSLDPENDSNVSQQIPLGRLGTPEDVASAVSYLASPAASYLTGTTIDINGGYRMQ